MITGEQLGKAIADALRLKAKRGAQADLARTLGIKPPSVSELKETGRLDKSKLPALWKFFSDVVGPGHWGLEQYPWTDESNAETAPSLGDFRKIGVVGTAQLGDDGYWAELEYPVGHGDGYVQHSSRDNNAYALRCRGDSMKPRIKNGEFVIIEPGHQPINGDEVMVKCKQGRVMVKELLYIRDGIVHLGSVNEAHGKITIPLQDVETIQYVAAIVKSSYWVPE